MNREFLIVAMPTEFGTFKTQIVLSDGRKIEQEQINGSNYRIGDSLVELDDGRFDIGKKGTVDPDCVGAVCPIK